MQMVPRRAKSLSEHIISAFFNLSKLVICLIIVISRSDILSSPHHVLVIDIYTHTACVMPARALGATSVWYHHSMVTEQ